MEKIDYSQKISTREESSCVVQEPAVHMVVNHARMSVRRRSALQETVLEESMPCYLSEEDLDKEIRLSMSSGNATQCDVDAVFCR